MVVNSVVYSSDITSVPDMYSIQFAVYGKSDSSGAHVEDYEHFTMLPATVVIPLNKSDVVGCPWSFI